MSVSFPNLLSCRLVVLSLVVLISACSVPEPASNRYQSRSGINQPEAAPVNELQKQALAAINQEQYQQAQDYLQRAIKIQPRNPWNWHYLAQTYWHVGQYDRCLAMLERANSYGSYDDQLVTANARFRPKCQGQG